MTAALVVVAFTAAYVLIATERVHRVAAALGGAAAMVVLGVVDTHVAFYSERTGVDWNVIFLLLGMMVIVSVLKQTGLFEFLAIVAAKRSRGRPFRLMVLLVVMTAVASALLDNVTTVLLVAPVTILVAEKFGARPEPFLIAVALASNIGGTATLIGDPPNIIIASRAGLTFNDFLLNLGPIVVVLMLIFVGLCWLMFRSSLAHDPASASAVVHMSADTAIKDKGMLVRCLVILAAVTAGFVAHPVIHLEPSLVALLGAGAMVAVSRLKASSFLEEVEWSTLVFFMGLFVMVGALVEVGVMDRLGHAATDAVGDHYWLAATGLLWGSAALSGLVDNIPYVATMSPLVGDLSEFGEEDPRQARGLWWSLALGADLGGNATAVGASANVVVLGVAARHGHPISFWAFTRYGLVVTVVTVAVAWPYLWLRYFS